MACPFDITVATNSVRLNAKRQGEAAFTVFNRSGRPLRGRTQLTPQQPNAAAWLTVVGDAERTFAIAGTEQITVQLTVPADAPAGNYAFRLDMVGVENPDEDFCSGPSVTFEVPEPAPAKPFPWLIVAAAVIAVLAVGGAALLLRPQRVTVPELRNSTVNEAITRLATEGLTVGNLLEGEAAGIAPGRVIGSAPPAGARVRRNSSVNLIIVPTDGVAPVRTPLPQLTRIAPRRP